MANTPKRGSKILTIAGYGLANLALIVLVTWAGGQVKTEFPSLDGVVRVISAIICVSIGIVTVHIYTTRHHHKS
ncbi:MAG TPA: hypothetical protein VLA77_03000 [Candidatus Saccharimonadales bacterium]|nr:hypothetical protein [Candidatus Saccharimonadales bacterium]